MARLLILLIALILLFLLAYVACRRPRHVDASPVSDTLPDAIAELALRAPRRQSGKLLPCRGTLRLLRQIVRSRAPWSPLTILQEHQRDLALLLMHLHRDSKSLPRLPADESGAPRMLLLSRELVRHESPCDAEALLHALSLWQASASSTHCERMLLPLCLRLALAERLHLTLLELRHDLRQAQQGHQLARKLPKSRRPMRRLAAAVMTPALADALAHQLRHDEQATLLCVLEDHLRQNGLSLTELSASHARAQAQYADQIMYCLHALRRLSALNWAEVEEAADPLHQLLMQDPSGVYPQMTVASRAHARQRAAMLAQRFYVDETSLVRGVLRLCQVPEKDGVTDHVGWYLLENDGIQALHRHLKARRGRASLFFLRHRTIYLRTVLILLNILAALWLLHRGYTLWLLPPLMMVTGCGIRFLLARLFPAAHTPPPQIALTEVPADLRTLVVMPAQLRSRSDAVPAVRRLLLCSHAMPKGAVDFLLLGDYGDSLTATSGEDSTIVYAAARAIDALNASQDARQFLYLQRRRSYDRRLHRYTGRDGFDGALTAAAQLIAEGSCPDEFDEATVSPASLRRRYAYMLVIPPEVTPSPDMLLPLMGALEHPLNRRHAAMACPVMTPDPDSLRTHMGQLHRRNAPPVPCFLADPRALHHAVETANAPLPALLLEELVGCVTVPDSTAYPCVPAAMSAWMQRIHRNALVLWRHLGWLLPWRSAEQGIERSPLARPGRRRLRRALGHTLLCAAQLITLLYAALMSDSLLICLALILPELRQVFPLDRHTPLQLLTRWGMLPLRATYRLEAALRALYLRFRGRELSLSLSDILPSMENWSQTLGALILALCSMTSNPPCLIGLVIAALFGCFPLIHTHLDRPVVRKEPLSGEMESSLMDIAHATWRCFEEIVNESSRYLPPERFQHKPWRGPSSTLRPDDAALYLLACLSAQELELTDADAMLQRIAHALDTLEALPLWQGLPYACYDLSSLTPTTSFVDAQRSGIFCACLLCAAQGLRVLLPDTPQEYHALPARLDALAHAADLSKLYDPAAQLFYHGIYTDTGEYDRRYHQLFASQALLLSFTAVALGQIPVSHMDVLSRTRARLGFSAALCSPDGSAADYLLALLLLPLSPGSDHHETIRAVVHAQRKSSIQGMYGASDCALWQFDEQMNYRCAAVGLPALALHPTRVHQAIAPYAAALCLPFDLSHACDSLNRLRSHGMLGRLGFFDTLDMDPARLPDNRDSETVQCYLSGHQAMLLCALCNALTGDHLVRTFSAIPSVAACSLLLRKPRQSGLLLPAAMLHQEPSLQREPSFRRQGCAGVLPLDAHIIGTAEASLTLSVGGSGVMRSRGRCLTRFTGAPGRVEGLQFYLNHGAGFTRLGDPALGGETVFAEGSIRIHQRLDALQCTLSAMVDPASATFLHVLEIVNMSGSEQFLELADCLVPGFASEHFTLRAARPSDRVLTLVDPDPHESQTLCHVLTTADPLIALHAHTDLQLFSPDESLAAPRPSFSAAADHFTAAPVNPCAGFCMQLSLGVRGRTTLVFTTRLLRPGEALSLESLTPRSSDLSGLLTLSRLACRAVYDALGLSQAQAALVSRTAGVILWRGQPHQGAVAPLRVSMQELPAYGVHPDMPLMTLLLYSPTGIPLLKEALDVLGWLTLSGQQAALCLLCMGAEAEAARKAAEKLLSAAPAREHVKVLMTASLPDAVRECIEAASRLLLYEGAGNLENQLDGLRVPLPAPLSRVPVTPLPLPAEALRFAHETGGWQEQTDDYILRLAPEEAAPRHWRGVLAMNTLTALTTPDGPGEIRLHDRPLTCGEEIWLETPEGAVSLMDEGFSRQVCFSAAQTRWQSYGDQLEMSLTASVIPDSGLCLRTLRVKNLTARPRTLTLHTAVRFPEGSCLTPLPCGMAALHPEIQTMVCLAMPEGSATFRRLSEAVYTGEHHVPAGLNAPGEDTGCVALLSAPLQLSPSGSVSAVWLLSAVDSNDALEMMFSRIRQEGASALMRTARQHWSFELSQLTVSTPEAALNLLLNRLLPHQLRLPPSGRDRTFLGLLMSLRPLTLVSPAQARSTLLHCAACQYHDGDMVTLWHNGQPERRRMTADALLFVLEASAYITMSGDSAILQDTAPYMDAPGESLHAHCMRALTSIRLGRSGIPMTEGGDLHGGFPLPHAESMLLGLIFACALQAYAPLAPADDRADIQEVHAHLTAAMEQNGWDGSWYLRGFTHDHRPLGSANTSHGQIACDVQAWAIMALKSSGRTLQALDSAWQALWDPAAGTLRTLASPYNAADDPAAPTRLLPGFASNGGLDTLCAAWMLTALCLAGQYDRAWLLLRSLNPVLHPTPHHEPWLLPGMLTLEGRVLTEDTCGAAGVFYCAVMEHLLGFHLQGNHLHLSPHVPHDWDAFSITLLRGTSTWHFHFSRSDAVLTLDGEECPDGLIPLTDDGHIHQVRAPLA